MRCDTCDGTGRCTYPSIDAQSLVVVACPDCDPVEPNIVGGYVESYIGFGVLPVCNCTEEGLPYCGDPECDVDWCQECGDEYTEPCARHAEVGRP